MGRVRGRCVASRGHFHNSHRCGFHAFSLDCNPDLPFPGFRKHHRSGIEQLVPRLLAGWLARDSSYLPALQISFVAIPALTMLALDAAFARAFGWMALSASAEQVVRPLVLIALGAICLQWFPELTASGWVTLCALAYVVSALGQHAVVRRLIAGKGHTGAEEQLRHDWLRVGFGMLLLGSAQLIRANTDLLLVGSMLGPAELGIYTAAVRTATLVAFLFP